MQTAHIKCCQMCRTPHAKIVTANGTESHEFFSKEAGRDIIEYSVQTNQITLQEGEFLRAEIDRLPLQAGRCMFSDTLEASAYSYELATFEEDAQDDEKDDEDCDDTPHTLH